MDDTQKVDSDPGEERPKALPYVPPEVVDYGDASDLTQSGAYRTGMADAATHNYDS